MNNVKNILLQIIRILVGVTFVFSGFVKMVDPLGSSYKFEEYFGADVLHLEFLIPYALVFSILLILFETLLGFFLLLGYKTKFTVWSLLGMISFFTFLTWYAAYFNKVTDCGCFGDAIILTPWVTFWKDVVLLVLILLLVRFQSYIKGIFPKRVLNWLALIALVSSLLLSFYVVEYLPIIDFRPFAIGKNIPDGMVMPPNAKKAIYKDTWTYSVNGVTKQYTTKEAPWNLKGAIFVSRKTVKIQDGYVPPIHDFTMEKDGKDVTNELMKKDKLMLIVSYNLSKANRNGFANSKKITDKAIKKGYTVYGFSSSTVKEFDIIKKKYHLNFDLLFCDETTLKTIVRANPAIVILHDGTITGKYSWRSIKNIKL